jgi:hypothetical protein
MSGLRTSSFCSTMWNKVKRFFYFFITTIGGRMKVFFLIALFIICSSVEAQTLFIRLRDGTVESVPFIEIRKITFDLATSVGDLRNDFPQRVRSFVLLQNYPNPFNPSTKIEYQIDKPGTVALRIYDSAGRLVSEMNNDYGSPGNKIVEWEGKDNQGMSVASGVYFYQVISEGVVQSKKMLLVK